jgi:hypothetical protein
VDAASRTEEHQQYQADKHALDEHPISAAEGGGGTFFRDTVLELAMAEVQIQEINLGGPPMTWDSLVLTNTEATKPVHMCKQIIP